MATAADLVIAEVRELVETGAIAPEAVRTPGIFVDYMVAPAKNERPKEQIRISIELKISRLWKNQ